MKKVAIFNDTSASKHYGCVLVMHNLKKILLKNNLKPVFFWPVGRDWRPFAEKIKNNCNYQAIIVNGEGSIHNSKNRLRAVYLSELATFSKNQLKIPSYLINATVFKNEKKVYKNFKNFTRIFVRENKTLNELKKNNIFSTVVPDLTFAFEEKEKWGGAKKRKKKNFNYR